MEFAHGQRFQTSVHERPFISWVAPFLIRPEREYSEQVRSAKTEPFAARQSQIQELAGFIAVHSSADRPMILLGDLNVTADYPIAVANPGSEYRRLINMLRYNHGPLVDVWPTLKTSRGGTSEALAGETSRRIDYIFMSPARAKAAASLTPNKVQVLRFLDKQVREGSLSDHAGVECEVC